MGGGTTPYLWEGLRKYIFTPPWNILIITVGINTTLLWERLVPPWVGGCPLFSWHLLYSIVTVKRSYLGHFSILRHHNFCLPGQKFMRFEAQDGRNFEFSESAWVWTFLATKLSYLKTKKKTDGPSYPTHRLWAAYFEINRKHSESDEMMILGPIILLLGESFQAPKHLVRNRTHMFCLYFSNSWLWLLSCCCFFSSKTRDKMLLEKPQLTLLKTADDTGEHTQLILMKRPKLPARPN